MKKALLFTTVLTLCMTGCEKPQIVVAPTPEPTSSPTPAPQPAMTPLAVETPKQLAPEGTLFLTERISVMTEDGIHGVPLGTNFLVVERNGDTITGEFSGKTFTVDASKTTDDMAVLLEIIAKNSSAITPAKQAASDQSPASRPTPKDGTTIDYAALEADRVARAKAVQATALEQKISKAEARIVALRTETMAAIHRGNSPSSSENNRRSNEIAGLQKAIAELRLQIQALR